ncbi:hypothetical protein E2C01_045795 [Portunus trituberculatus]|uniref:Uncharacterized protein n=1 Tax=Portunus trituberculatus TaxID=210409 RepID=A0A5B7G2Z7_PORTR|nr:hypothetical protein [Portunus trituberculatus]
MVIFPGDRRGS